MTTFALISFYTFIATFWLSLLYAGGLLIAYYKLGYKPRPLNPRFCAILSKAYWPLFLSMPLSMFMTAMVDLTFLGFGVKLGLLDFFAPFLLLNIVTLFMISGVLELHQHLAKKD